MRPPALAMDELIVSLDSSNGAGEPTPQPPAVSAAKQSGRLMAADGSIPMAITEQTEAPEAGPTVKQQEWLDNLHAMYVFYAEHPDLIPDTGVMTSMWASGTPEQQRVQVEQLTAGLGQPILTDNGMQAYVQLAFDRFAPHRSSLYVTKESIGHKVEKLTESWEWDFGVSA